MRRIVVASVILLAGSSLASATPFTVNSGVTDNAVKTLTGTETGTVNAGGALSTTNTAITWSGSSAAPGVTIDNSGIISSSTARGIDTSGSSTTRNLTLNNNLGATLSGSNDAFRINSNVVGGTVTINNSGTIISIGGGQALDFDAVSSTTANIQIINNATGVISATAADAMRPGQNATVTNYGLICGGTASGGACTGGVINENHDGVDWQGRSGTLINKTGGVISSTRHGTTSDADVNVTNEAGALISGRNGSGVGSDGTGTVVNHGTIRGAYNGVAINGDGDGVDIDFTANITNYGVIEGLGAAGNGSDGFANTSQGLAIGGGTVVNHLGARISGAATGMLVDNSSQGPATEMTQLTNAGLIEGLAGLGVKLVGSQNDVVENAGTIKGTLGALDLGGGDDLLKLATGSTIDGLADGGDGFDTIEILSDVTLGEVINFERLEIDGSAILTLAATMDIDEIIDAQVVGLTIANIVGNGFNFFYDVHDADNAYLGGLSYALAGGGKLVAAPEPETLALFLPGLIALAAGARRRKPSSSRMAA